MPGEEAGADKMTYKVKVLAPKTNDLSSIPRTYVMDVENQLLQVVL